MFAMVKTNKPAAPVKVNPLNRQTVLPDPYRLAGFR
jgi:hypothetical protein